MDMEVNKTIMRTSNAVDMCLIVNAVLQRLVLAHFSIRVSRQLLGHPLAPCEERVPRLSLVYDLVHRQTRPDHEVDVFLWHAAVVQQAEELFCDNCDLKPPPKVGHSQAGSKHAFTGEVIRLTSLIQQTSLKDSPSRFTLKDSDKSWESPTSSQLLPSGPHAAAACCPYTARP